MKTQMIHLINEGLLAQTDLKGGLAKILGIIMMLAFVSGVIMVVTGALKWNKDPESAKQSMLGGGVVAGATAIVTLLFKAFGLDFGITPDVSGF